MRGSRMVVAGLAGGVVLLTLVAACGETVADGTGRGTRAALWGGSCEGACGGLSDDGTCWCDDACAEYGDCCDDKAALCDAPPTCVEPPPAPAEGGCFADEQCGAGEHCEGASYCPCGAYCLVADTVGTCVPDAPPCMVTGCSGQLCTEEQVMTTCEWLPIYACYQDLGVCERQADGSCGWTKTPELQACLDQAATPAPAPDPMSCEGACGGAAPGGCYCDDLCEYFGDCCDDVAEVCAP